MKIAPCIAAILMTLLITACEDKHYEFSQQAEIPIKAGLSATVKTSLACSDDLLELATPQLTYTIAGEQSEPFTPSDNEWENSCDFYSFRTNDVTMKYLSKVTTISDFAKRNKLFELSVIFIVDESKAIDPEKTYRFAYGLHCQLLYGSEAATPLVNNAAIDVRGTDNVKAYLKRLAEESNLTVKVKNENGKLIVTK